MMNDDSFFDNNPVIDDKPTPMSRTLTVSSLPTDMRMGEPVFTNMRIARDKLSGLLELRLPTWRERLALWIDKRPRLKAFIEGAAFVAMPLFPRRPR